VAKVIAIANQKGGTGKTTTALNLGAYLAALGKKVLLVDLDPQGNATGGLGIKPENLAVHVYHALVGKVPARDIMRSTGFYGYDLLPAAPDLAGATVELVDVPEREFKLKGLLDTVSQDYDYIIIDCPPSLGVLTINGLAAADEVLIPVQAEFFSLQGVRQIEDTVKLIRENFGTDLGILGALITLYDRRNASARANAKELRRTFGGRVFDTVIPRAIALADAPARGLTILQFASDSPGAHAYRQLAEEIVNIHAGVLSDTEEEKLQEDIESE